MWNIIGQDRSVDLLQRAIDSGRLPHALLLTGPAGVGKTRLATELAKALNCINPEPPCGHCVHCHQIDIGSHPDVTVIERPEGKDSIPIQAVRELRESASLRPFQGRFRVFIVAGAEALTAQAADAILKTLEEPQPQVCIVLTAQEAEALPETVVSRCREITLQAVDPSVIAAALQKQGVETDAADRLARLSLGSAGWAFAASKQLKVVQQQEELLDRLTTLLDLGLDGRLALAEMLAAEKKDRSSVRRSLEFLLLLARDLLLLSQGREPKLASGKRRETLARQTQRYSLAQLAFYLQRLRLTMERIDQNVDPRLALEALVVSVP